MSFDLSNYGQPIKMATKNFTKDMQEDIVRNHFSGTPGGVYNKMATAQNEQARPSSRPLNEGTSNEVRLTREEYNNLLNANRGMTPNSPQPSQQMNEQQTQQPAQYNQAAGYPQPVTNDGNNETSDYDKMLNEILGVTDSGTQQSQQQSQQAEQSVAQPQQSKQQQQGQPSFEEIQQRQRLDTYSRSIGVDSKEVLDFANNLSIEEIVDLYAAYKQAQQQSQQQRPINLSETNGVKGVVNNNPFPQRQRIKSIF